MLIVGHSIAERGCSEKRKGSNCSFSGGETQAGRCVVAQKQVQKRNCIDGGKPSPLLHFFQAK